MKARHVLLVLVATSLFGLSPQPVLADRIDDVVQWMNNSITVLSRDTQTLRQLLDQEQARRVEGYSQLQAQIWQQQKRNIDTFREIRKRLSDIEKRLFEQDRIIKNLASQ